MNEAGRTDEKFTHRSFRRPGLRVLKSRLPFPTTESGAGADKFDVKLFEIFEDFSIAIVPKYDCAKIIQPIVPTVPPNTPMNIKNGIPILLAFGFEFGTASLFGWSVSFMPTAIFSGSLVNMSN